MNSTTALTKLEILRILRNGRYLIFSIAMPAVLYLAIGNSSKDQVNGADFKAYYMLAMATYGAFAGALMGNAVRISTERKDGWTRQLRLTPLPGWGYVVSKVIASLVTTIPSVLVVFLMGALMNGVKMSAANWVIVALSLWVASMIFASLAVAIGYRFDPDATQPAVMLVFFPMAILGGLWFPIKGTMAKIGEWLPTYQAHKIGTDVISGAGVEAKSFAIVLAWGVLFIALAAAAYRSANKDA